MLDVSCCVLWTQNVVEDILGIFFFKFIEAKATISKLILLIITILVVKNILLPLIRQRIDVRLT